MGFGGRSTLPGECGGAARARGVRKGRKRGRGPCMYEMQGPRGDGATRRSPRRAGPPGRSAVRALSAHQRSRTPRGWRRLPSASREAQYRLRVAPMRPLNPARLPLQVAPVPPPSPPRFAFELPRRRLRTPRSCLRVVPVFAGRAVLPALGPTAQEGSATNFKIL